MVGEFSDIPQPEDIPLEVLQIIEQEVYKDIAPILEEDLETAEILRVYMKDYRTSMYLFLRWFDRKINPQRILYPASGHDIIPKITFGQDRVVHTSLEGHKIPDKPYFLELGEGNKIIADNISLPFGNSTFQAVVLVNPPEDIKIHLQEFDRVLEYVGALIIARMTHELIHKDELDITNGIVQYYEQSRRFKRVSIPDQLQKRGESETEFIVFRKNK